MARLLDNARYLRQGFATSACAVIEPGTLPDGSEATTPVVPVVVGEDCQAALLWKALFDAGVYTNVAIHPAVPPGGALLRTSLMATHEREHLDRALAIIERTIVDFPDLPRGLRRPASLPRTGDFRLVRCPAQGRVCERKSLLLANELWPIAAVPG